MSGLWITKAIDEQHIQLFKNEDFKNKKYCAKGGRAEIEYAEWPCSERKVALKILKPYEVQKFIQEVKMHTSSHWSKNVVRFLGIIKRTQTRITSDDIDELEQQVTEEEAEGPEYIMVMEYAELNNLRDFLKNNNSSNINWDVGYDLRYKLSLDIAKGLNCLHSHNIIHRDLHTENIVVKRINCCQRFIAQITDFGSSILVGSETDFIELDGRIAFTDPMCLDNKDCKRTKQSDIYGLGVIFWEILFGKAPFKNYKPNNKKRRNLLLIDIAGGKREVTPASDPENFIELYKTCWDHDRSKRPEIRQVIRVLRNIEKINLLRVREILSSSTENGDDEFNDDELNDDDDESDDSVNESGESEPGESIQNINNVPEYDKFNDIERFK